MGSWAAYFCQARHASMVGLAMKIPATMKASPKKNKTATTLFLPPISRIPLIGITMIKIRAGIARPEIVLESCWTN